MAKLWYIEHQLNQLIWGWGGVLFLLVSAFWFLFRTRRLLFRPWLILRALFAMMRGAQGKQARRQLYTALAGTLGIGSIVGVASALALGGAGALVWMLVSGVLGMALKYAETVLACAYQRRQGEGWIGGAMVLLGEVKHHVWLSVCFSLFTLIAAFGVGCMAPSAAICEGASNLFSLPKPLTAALLAFLVLAVLKGKAKRIQTVNARIIPVVSLLYLCLCAGILFAFRDRLPAIVSFVLADAFRPLAAGGGIGGFLLSRSLHYGLTRGLFSHEAGMGSAPLAYAAVRCEEPAEQGFLGMLEVFFDTFVISLPSALVCLCLFSNGIQGSADGAALMRACFASFYGGFGGALFSLMLMLFAFPTILGWYYYAAQCLKYLFYGRWAKHVYLLFFLTALFCGGLAQAGAIWELCDTLNGCMLLINLCALWMLQGECARISEAYRLTHQGKGSKAARR